MRPTIILSLLASFIPYLATARWTTNDPCPTEIKATIPNGRTEFDSMVSVHDALSHCPNITSLDVRVTLMVCSEWPDRWNFPFNANGGDNYPALKKVRLDGYDFSNADDTRAPWEMPFVGLSVAEAWTSGVYDWLAKGYWQPWLRAQIYGYPVLPPPKSNLDLWLGAMNWSTVEELALEDCSLAEEFVEKLPSRLLSLRQLTSTNISFVEALPKNTLESLTWIGPNQAGDLALILERHGPKLQELEFRWDEMGYPSMRNTFNISIIPELAPNLTRLSINIPRNGSWPLESLQTLAQLRQLHSLEIYSNLQSECQQQAPEPWTREGMKWKFEDGAPHCTKEDRFQKPLLNESNAEQMYDFLKTANTGGVLQRVTFRVGDWSRLWDGPLYEPQWMEGRKVEIGCSEGVIAEGKKRCTMTHSCRYWPPESNIRGGVCWMYDD